MASQHQESDAGFFVREAIKDAEAGYACWARAQQSLRNDLEYYKTRLDGYKADKITARVISAIAIELNKETEPLSLRIAVLGEVMKQGQMAMGKLKGEQYVVPPPAPWSSPSR